VFCRYTTINSAYCWETEWRKYNNEEFHNFYSSSKGLLWFSTELTGEKNKKDKEGFKISIVNPILLMWRTG
jgi:hypothetical protein